MRTIFFAFAALTAGLGTAHADCTAEVNDAFAKLRKASAFSMSTTITNPQGTLTMSNDYVLPDRMHQTVTMSSGAPGKMEMILVSGKAWSNQGNAGWAEVPSDFASKIAQQMKETVTEPPKDASPYECLGDVALDGKTYAAYRTKRVATEGGETKTGPTVQTVYIDKGLGIPARNIVTSEAEPDKRLFDGAFSLRDGLKIDPPKL